MENQIIIAAINEAIQKAVPTIVEEVTQKLNNREQTKKSRKELWENLTLDDIKNLAVSSDYRDRCKAASHPKTTSDILNHLEGDSDKRVVSAVCRVMFRYQYDGLASLDMAGIIEKIRYGETKNLRNTARKLLKEKLFAGKFDNEITSFSSTHIHSFCYPVELHIAAIKNSDHNTSYFAKLMLEYRFMCLRKTLTEEENLLLDYSFKNLNKNHE